MAKKPNDQIFIEHFEKKESFTTDDVYDFYSRISPNIKRTTVNWRIYNLVQRGILLRTGRGVYAIGKEKSFVPASDKRQNNISKSLKKQFPFVPYCCWNISILTEFYLHLPAINFMVIEVEKDSLDAVFYFLKESHKNLFKEPSKALIEDFIADKTSAVIIKPLISESPLLKIEGISVPSLEKVLVDILTEKELFYFLQGNELLNIFKNAVEKYTVNYSKLLRYAKRRGKEEEAHKILGQITGSSLE